MARTTPALVEGIIEVPPGIDVNPYIEAANDMVTTWCGEAGYSAAKEELIERWLAAHFLAVNYPRTVFEGAGTVQESFESKVDLGLNVTRYGQQAMLLDSGGYLAAFNNATQKAVVTLPGSGGGKRGAKWLGREEW